MKATIQPVGLAYRLLPGHATCPLLDVGGHIELHQIGQGIVGVDQGLRPSPVLYQADPAPEYQLLPARVPF